MKQTKIAVITRTKNRPLLLERAILSVINQSYADWQHVIVNDGGNPKEIEDLVEKYVGQYNGRITVVHNEKSFGMEAASNMGINNSASEHIVIHDDDDSWDKDFLSEMTAALVKEKEVHPNTKAIICHSVKINEILKNDEIKIIKKKPYNNYLKVVSLIDMVTQNQFPPISFLFERKAAEELEFFDETLPVLGDWDFHLRFLGKYNIAVLPKELANYHHRKQSKGNYGNSVIDGVDKHIVYNAIYTNRNLRKIPVHELIYQGRILKESRDQFWRLSKKIYTWIVILFCLQVMLILFLKFI